MRCRTCDYPLWNLKTRLCPECGSPYSADEYDFRPNTVCFCCPHCDQAYYGTGERGHLEPRTFACVNCGQHLSMNEMVLLPAEGLAEAQTRAAFNRWLERHRAGWFKSWCSTIGQSLISPQQLMQGTPVESSMKHAWWFLTFTIIAVLLASLVPVVCMMVGMPFVFSASGGAPPGAPGAGFMAGIMAGATLVSFVIAVPVTLVFTLLWGLTAHGILRLSGRGHGPIRRTFQALCYSSGAYVTSVIPCVGGYAGPIWWVVSAVLMVRAGHKVGGVRATFAVATFPVVLVVLLVAAYVSLVAFAVYSSASTAAGGFSSPIQETRVVLDAVLAHASDHEGRGPAHALALVEGGSMTEWDFVGRSTATDVSGVPVSGALDLVDFAVLPPSEQQEVVEEAAEALPDGVTAYRVGDFVFTYPGLDLADARAGLWVVVMAPDPDAAVSRVAPGPVVVGTVDGTVQAITRSRLAAALARQNELRAEVGLPPLPDPTLLTHDAPAAGPP
ncbi:MAG: hypothetical protein ACYSWT_07615 [Planctomycetota bacterium]|jgi:hypothetical protein